MKTLMTLMVLLLSAGGAEAQDSRGQIIGLEIEVRLGAHHNRNNTPVKAEKLKAGKGPNPFIAPSGWKDFPDKMIARDQSR